MGTGGRRVRAGRPPDPWTGSGGSDWRQLPPEGRTGRTPQFPLTRPTERERTLWRRLWRLPQAVEWERTHQELTVATYVRALARAEQPDSAVGLFTTVKQLADILGLTEPGMRSNRWRITTDTRPVRASTPKRGSRARLKVVDPDLIAQDDDENPGEAAG